MKKMMTMMLMITGLALVGCGPPPPAPPSNPCGRTNDAQANAYGWDQTGPQVTADVLIETGDYNCPIRVTVRPKHVTVGGITMPEDVLAWADPSATIWLNGAGTNRWLSFQMLETPGSPGGQVYACFRNQANTRDLQCGTLFGWN